LLTSRPRLSRELAAAVDVAAIAAEVLAMAVVMDMALAVAAVLFMAMEATKQQRKLQDGGSGLQHGPGGATSGP